MLMIVLGEPSNKKIEEFLFSQTEQSFSYKDIGMTREAKIANSDYVIDHYRTLLGKGSLIFDRGVSSLKNWQQFKIGWLKIWPSEVNIETGATICLLISFTAWYFLCACRIVYVINEDGPVKRFGFAYGTLPEHPACGEERFLVEWDTTDNNVWYDVLAFSHPAGFLTKLAYPISRIIQKKFAQDSKQAMLRAFTSVGKENV